MNMKRILQHLASPYWSFNKKFPPATLQDVTAAVRAAEAGHDGQIRVVVEPTIALGHILRGVTPRQRAIEVFSQLRVWDTERNNGVLIYLCLADRQVEIVADRGINCLAGPAEWERICQQMETAFRAGDFKGGVLSGIASVGKLLSHHYGADMPLNELPDFPAVL